MRRAQVQFFKPGNLFPRPNSADTVRTTGLIGARCDCRIPPIHQTRSSNPGADGRMKRLAAIVTIRS
jgi:hypothetical protein